MVTDDYPLDCKKGLKMNIRLEDEWVEPTSMRNAFIEAMIKTNHKKPRKQYVYAQTIDYSKIDVGEEITDAEEIRKP